MSTKKTESPITFPCDYLVKVMGEADDTFEDKVVTIAKRHAAKVHIDSIKRRHSKNHNYLAITLTVHLETREQLDALYMELRETPEVLMAL